MRDKTNLEGVQRCKLLAVFQVSGFVRDGTKILYTKGPLLDPPMGCPYTCNMEASHGLSREPWRWVIVLVSLEDLVDVHVIWREGQHLNVQNKTKNKNNNYGALQRGGGPSPMSPSTVRVFGFSHAFVVRLPLLIGFFSFDKPDPTSILF